MSTVIEAIIYPNITSEQINRVIDLDRQIVKVGIQFNIELKKYQFNNSISIILNTSNDRVFDDNFSPIARKISTQTHKALLALYNDQIGYRYSCIFTGGDFTKEFTPEDEIWVLVDEEYKPLLEREFSSTEVDEDKNEDNEYKTLYNAIELGLNEIGMNEEWDDIFDSILRVY